jgi:hypothetical protein
VFSVYHEHDSLFIKDEQGKNRRDLYDPPPPVVVLKEEKTPIDDPGRMFLETHNNVHSKHKNSKELSDEELEELIYGPTVHDPLQVDWDRERTLLKWRKGPQYFNERITISDTNHPFDKTRRCLGKMFHLDHILTSKDCLYVDDKLIHIRNKEMSMSVVQLPDWKLFDSKKSINDFIRQLKSSRDHNEYTHTIVAEFKTDSVRHETVSLCDMYLYWISYEAQNVTCIPVYSNLILFDLSNQFPNTSEEMILDLLSRFKETDELRWRGISSNPKENPSWKDHQIIHGYSKEEHFMNSLFLRREN